MNQPTPTQLEYIEAIEGYWLEHGSAPTQLELCGLVKRTATSIAYMLDRLVDGGFVHSIAGKSRSIRTTRTEHTVIIGAWQGKAP